MGSLSHYFHQASSSCTISWKLTLRASGCGSPPEEGNKHGGSPTHAPSRRLSRPWAAGLALPAPQGSSRAARERPHGAGSLGGLPEGRQHHLSRGRRRGGGEGPRKGAARQQGGEGQVPSPTSVTSVPLRPPLAAVPMPRSPRAGEPHDGGPQGRSEGSPFPPTPTPLTASRGGRGSGTEPDRSPPHSPPLPAAWSRPLSTNQSSPLQEEGVICISACGLALPTVPLVEIYRGRAAPPNPSPRCP